MGYGTHEQARLEEHPSNVPLLAWLLLAFVSEMMHV